jgi:hypothetical protein
MSSFWFDLRDVVRPRDPAIVGAVAALVAFAGFVACFASAQRGLRIDPALALRDE